MYRYVSHKDSRAIWRTFDGYESTKIVAVAAAVHGCGRSRGSEGDETVISESETAI